MPTTQIPRLIYGQDLKKYFLAHVAEAPINCDFGEHFDGLFYQVVHDIHVFKKVVSRGGYDVVANLIIPEGEFIYAAPDCFSGAGRHSRKMRATGAKVHSMFDRNGVKVDKAFSIYSAAGINNLTYTRGKIVKPACVDEFFITQTCAQGIHFFLNLTDAYNY